MDGSGIVSRRREAQWKIKLIKFTSRLSWGTDKFPTIYCFAQLQQEESRRGKAEKPGLSNGALGSRGQTGSINSKDTVSGNSGGRPIQVQDFVCVTTFVGDGPATPSDSSAPLWLCSLQPVYYRPEPLHN